MLVTQSKLFSNIKYASYIVVVVPSVTCMLSVAKAEHKTQYGLL